MSVGTTLPKISTSKTSTGPIIKDLKGIADKLEPDMILGQDLSPINVVSKTRKLSEHLADQSNVIETEALLQALDKAGDLAAKAMKSPQSNVLNTLTTPIDKYKPPNVSKGEI